MLTHNPSQTLNKTQSPASSKVSDDLEALLRGFISKHERLLQLTIDHHQAIRQADAPRCDAVARESQLVLSEIAALDSQRQALIKRVQTEIKPTGPLSKLSDIARALPDPIGPALLDLSDKLRVIMKRVQEEQNLLRVVSRVLLAHMEGLMRQVAHSLSHSGTYAKTGAVAAGAPIVTSLDVSL